MPGAGDQYASLCQISSKSVKRLQRYVGLTAFKMAAVRHLGFLKFNFFNSRSGALERAILHHQTKFCKFCGDIAISMIFKMAAAAILDLQKFEVLTVNPLSGTNMRERVKFHQTWSNGCRDMAT